MSTLNYQLQVTTIDGQSTDLSNYKDEVLLIVNTASKCGFTPQFEQLEELYARYRERGFSVLGFPCNQFMGQEPGDSQQIAEFCQKNYGVSFPMFEKIDVNGKNAHPLFEQLKQHGPKGVLGRAIKWNFTKFLIGRDGTIRGRYAPKTLPSAIERDLIDALELAP